LVAARGAGKIGHDVKRALKEGGLMVLLMEKVLSKQLQDQKGFLKVQLFVLWM
jgi:phosphoglycerate dehydrogenase-like enzyme